MVGLQPETINNTMKGTGGYAGYIDSQISPLYGIGKKRPYAYICTVDLPRAGFPGVNRGRFFMH